MVHRTLETVHTCFSSMFLYLITVTYYGDPIALQFTHWTINSSAIFVGLIGTIVQVCAHQNIDRYVWRTDPFLALRFGAHTGYTSYLVVC